MAAADVLSGMYAMLVGTLGIVLPIAWYTEGAYIKQNSHYYKVSVLPEVSGADPGGGARGPWPPPSPQKIAPPNSQARIQGGQEGLAPLTKSWIRLLVY